MYTHQLKPKHIPYLEGVSMMSHLKPGWRRPSLPKQTNQVYNAWEKI